MTFSTAALFLACYFGCDAVCPQKQPNIIFIVADDAGWNDFSFHGSSQIPTPNIDAIGLNGIVLNSYYSSPLCTPSRGATLTGKYPIHLGLQHYVITGGMEAGLPLTEKLLPEYLKELGYSTHLVGKWHLGHARKAYAPTNRGFDSHYGYYLGAHDYYNHLCRWRGQTGYDFRKNLTVDFTAFGKYATDLFTEEAVKLINEHSEDKPLFLMISHVAPHSAYKPAPLQAPEENIRKFNDSIEDESRRKYAGIVDRLDESVGDVMEALANRKLLKDSIVVFISDNGGAPSGYDLNQASNWPLRGMKNTLWEGGTRLAACMWSPLLDRPRVNKHIVHSVDWLPTLLEAAGHDVTQLDSLDGVSQWQHLIGQGPAPRKTFLYNIDPINDNAAVRFENWKLIQGKTSQSDLGSCPPETCDGWYGPSGRVEDAAAVEAVRADLISRILNSASSQAFAKAGYPLDKVKGLQVQKEADVSCGNVETIACKAADSPCLFDIEADPCEKRNLASKEVDVVEFLQGLIRDYNRTAIPVYDTRDDPMYPPYKNNYVWNFFKDEL